MKIRLLQIVTCWMCVVGLSYGDGYRNPPADVVALARSGAGYTRSGDVGVLAFTPANVLSVTNRQVELNMLLASTDIKHKHPDGAVTKNREEAYLLPNLFSAFPLSKDLTLGLSVTTPYGQGVEYDRFSRFSSVGPYRAELAMVDIAPTVAFRASDFFWISAGVDLYVAHLELEQNIPWTAFGAPPSTRPGVASVDADAGDIGVTLSAALRPLEGHVLTLTWRSGPEMDFEGDFETSRSPVPTALVPNSEFETRIKFPHQLMLAYGIQLSDSFEVEVYAEWIEWSRNQSLLFDAGANQSLIPGPILNDWNDTVSYGVGGSYMCSPLLTFHAGYAFIETPIPDHTLAPSLVDADRHAFSFGCSWEKGAHRIDVGGTLSLHDDRTIVRSDIPLFSGTYETTSALFGVSYAFTY